MVICQEKTGIIYLSKKDRKSVKIDRQMIIGYLSRKDRKSVKIDREMIIGCLSRKDRKCEIELIVYQYRKRKYICLPRKAGDMKNLI